MHSSRDANAAIELFSSGRFHRAGSFPAGDAFSRVKQQQKQQPMKTKHTVTTKPVLVTLIAISSLAAGMSSGLAATGEVTLSGSTWTGKVDGSTKYTGPSVSDATEACNNAMTSGTIYIRNSATMPSVNKCINISSNKRINGTGRTLTSSQDAGIIGSDNSSTVGVDNLNIAGSSWYGMYFRTCNGQSFSGVNGTAGIAYRIDNCKGGPGSNFSCGSVTIPGGGSHGIETYGISGVSWGTVTVSDRSGGCGILLNQSTSASGSTINATRCNFGGGYAGFRVANNNRNTTVGTVNSTSCGRGFFSVSGSRYCTINTMNATSCSGIGIWLQSTGNTRINSGTVRNCSSCWSISSDLGGNSINVSCQ
jgi:hypothetical protein